MSSRAGATANPVPVRMYAIRDESTHWELEKKVAQFQENFGNGSLDDEPEVKTAACWGRVVGLHYQRTGISPPGVKYVGIEYGTLLKMWFISLGFIALTSSDIIIDKIRKAQRGSAHTSPNIEKMLEHSFYTSATGIVILAGFFAVALNLFVWLDRYNDWRCWAREPNEDHVPVAEDACMICREKVKRDGVMLDRKTGGGLYHAHCWAEHVATHEHKTESVRMREGLEDDSGRRTPTRSRARRRVQNPASNVALSYTDVIGHVWEPATNTAELEVGSEAASHHPCSWQRARAAVERRARPLVEWSDEHGFDLHWASVLFLCTLAVSYLVFGMVWVYEDGFTGMALENAIYCYLLWKIRIIVRLFRVYIDFEAHCRMLLHKNGDVFAMLDLSHQEKGHVDTTRGITHPGVMSERRVQLLSDLAHNAMAYAVLFCYKTLFYWDVASVPGYKDQPAAVRGALRWAETGKQVYGLYLSLWMAQCWWWWFVNKEPELRDYFDEMVDPSTGKSPKMTRINWLTRAANVWRWAVEEAGEHPASHNQEEEE